jgi:hypothetical protein
LEGKQGGGIDCLRLVEEAVDEWKEKCSISVCFFPPAEHQK